MLVLFFWLEFRKYLFIVAPERYDSQTSLSAVLKHGLDQWYSTGLQLSYLTPAQAACHHSGKTQRSFLDQGTLHIGGDKAAVDLLVLFNHPQIHHWGNDGRAER